MRHWRGKDFDFDYIELIVSLTGEFFFGLNTDHHMLNALHCEDWLMHYG